MEKKLTVEDIVKDIERSTGMPSYWKRIVLDLIQRQKVEIEQLSKDYESVVDMNTLYQADHKLMSDKLIELEVETNNQQAEIKRLTEEKDEAVKETAKEILKTIKLNGTLGYGGYVIHDSTIEKIAKEYGVEVEYVR